MPGQDADPDREEQEPESAEADGPGERPGEPPRHDDDSPVERYRDSPGIGMFSDDVEPPEPNEPG